MSVRAIINGREFTFGWEEFERIMLRKDLTVVVEILEVK